MSKQSKQPKENGRPTKYHSDLNKVAYKFALLGVTEKELADFLEVSIDTITEWKNRHSSFSASLKRGKNNADAMVAKRLYQRAIGYSYTETTFEKIILKEEKENAAEIVMQDAYKTKIVKKHMAPDTVAGIFWLKNRQRELWMDTQKVEVTGSVKSYKIVAASTGRRTDDSGQ